MADPHANPGLRAFLIAPDLRMAEELKTVLASELPHAATHTLETYSGAPLPDTRRGSIDLCFLDFASDQAAASRTLSALVARHPAPPVVALLERDDPDLILRCLRQGAAEFLVRPFTAEQLRTALAKLSRFHPRSNGGPDKAGRVFGAIPAKGACGGTSVACNLAFALKRLHSGRVLLADLDGLTGTVPFLLKLKSNYSFVDALSHVEHLDAELWRALVTPCQGVDVLLSPENPVESFGQSWDPVPLLDSSRRLYEVVMLDLSGAYGDWNLALASLCDQVLLVATSELPALHAAQRATAYLLENGIDPGRIGTVVNRYRNGVGLSRENIEAALGTELLHVLPNDYEAMQKALLEGRPVPGASDFGKGVAALATRLSGRTTEARKSGGFLSSIFRRNSN